METEELPAYCAVAMAGLGNLPDTILSRCVVVRMRKRSPTEKVSPYRRKVHGPIGHQIRDSIESWASTPTQSCRQELKTGTQMCGRR